MTPKVASLPATMDHESAPAGIAGGSVNSLSDLAERYCSASIEKQPGIFKQFIVALRETIAAGLHDEAIPVLRRVVLPTLDYTSAQSLHRIFRQCYEKRASGQTIRLAVLGSFTTKQLAALLELYLFAAGVDAEVYEGEYDVFRQEILDAGSQLYEFAPQIVLLATSWRDLTHRPSFTSDRAEAEQAIQAEQADWSALWETLHGRLGCQVIQNNFVLPPWRSFANHEMRQRGSLGAISR